MSTKSILSILVVVLVVIIGFFVINNQEANAPGPEGDADITENQELSESERDVKEFNLIGTPFQFSMDEIRVSRGDRVRINFENGQGTHDWVVDEFGARTPIIQTGQKASVEFTADQSGEFDYYCSVGNHRALGMVGKLIVE